MQNRGRTAIVVIAAVVGGAIGGALMRAAPVGAQGPGGQGGVTIAGPLPLPVSGAVSGLWRRPRAALNVGLTGTPSVAISGTPAVTLAGIPTVTDGVATRSLLRPAPPQRPDAQGGRSLHAQLAVSTVTVTNFSDALQHVFVFNTSTRYRLYRRRYRRFQSEPNGGTPAVRNAAAALRTAGSLLAWLPGNAGRHGEHDRRRRSDRERVCHAVSARRRCSSRLAPTAFAISPPIQYQDRPVGLHGQRIDGVVRAVRRGRKGTGGARRGDAALHSAGQAGRECLHRELQCKLRDECLNSHVFGSVAEASRSWTPGVRTTISSARIAACRIERQPRWAQCGSTHVSHVSRLQPMKI